jgi:hypothetical protein
MLAIDAEASMMLSMDSTEFANAHGVQNQWERLAEHNQKLQGLEPTFVSPAAIWLGAGPGRAQ